MENRTPLIAGNWKMYKTPPEAAETAQQLVERLGEVSGVDIMIAPTFAALESVSRVINFPFFRYSPLSYTYCRQVVLPLNAGP